MKNSISILVITSPPLYKEAKDIIDSSLTNGKVISWIQGDKVGHAAINQELLSGKWQLCISFYNDYIFTGEEIKSVACMVNIHPALPSVRGRGYDILPLINFHSEHGATLHFVAESIDSGGIIEVFKQRVPVGSEYHKFRAKNQELSLLMLNNFLATCLNQVNVYSLIDELVKRCNQTNMSWSGDFLSSKKLHTLLKGLHSKEPENPIFGQIPLSFFV